MKLIIELNTEFTEEEIFEKFKPILIECFKDFEFTIEDTNLKYKVIK